MKLDIRLQVHEADLPATVHGITGLEEGTPSAYTVVINSGLEEEEKTLAFIHEMLHIWHSDFSSNLPASTLEAIRQKEATRILGHLAG